MHDDLLAEFRRQLEARMPPAAWKRIFDHHLNEAITGNVYSGRLILWLMTILDQELLRLCIDADLLQRWREKLAEPNSLKRSNQRPRRPR